MREGERMKITMFGHGMVADTHIAAIADNTEGMRLHQIVGRDADRTQAYAAKASKTLGYTVGRGARSDLKGKTNRAHIRRRPQAGRTM